MSRWKQVGPTEYHRSVGKTALYVHRYGHRGYRWSVMHDGHCVASGHADTIRTPERAMRHADEAAAPYTTPKRHSRQVMHARLFAHFVTGIG